MDTKYQIAAILGGAFIIEALIIFFTRRMTRPKLQEVKTKEPSVHLLSVLTLRQALQPGVPTKDLDLKKISLREVFRAMKILGFVPAVIDARIAIDPSLLDLWNEAVFVPKHRDYKPFEVRRGVPWKAIALTGNHDGGLTTKALDLFSEIGGNSYMVAAKPNTLHAGYFPHDLEERWEIGLT